MPLLSRTSALVLALGAALPASGQTIIARDGYEAFPWVEYVGGDATVSDHFKGILVLTDTTLAMYECEDSRWCDDNEEKGPYKGEPRYMLDLRQVTEVSSSNTVRGPTAGARLALGFLAGDRTEEFVGLVYESDTSAEAPIFKTQRAQSGAIEAKIRFRLKRLGVTLREPVGAPQ